MARRDWRSPASRAVADAAIGESPPTRHGPLRDRQSAALSRANSSVALVHVQYVVLPFRGGCSWAGALVTSFGTRSALESRRVHQRYVRRFQSDAGLTQGELLFARARRMYFVVVRRWRRQSGAGAPQSAGEAETVEAESFGGGL